MAILNADLLDDFARQRVALFLGAGVTSSAVTRSGSRIKGWDAFLRTACERVDEAISNQVKALLAVKDYLLACELLKDSIDDQWAALLLEEFNQVATPSELHRAIIGLDQRIILTTNFDKIIENTWETAIGNSTHLPKIMTKIDADAFLMLKDHRSKYLIKIHGTVDDPNTMVFSRSEYIRNAFGNDVYQAFIETLLLTYTFVFIGFSMEDPALSNLMEQYALKYPKARPHYIFAPQDTPDNIVAFNKKLRKLVFIKYNPKNNHAHLPVIVQEFADQIQARRRELFSESKMRAEFG